MKGIEAACEGGFSGKKPTLLDACRTECTDSAGERLPTVPHDQPALVSSLAPGAQADPASDAVTAPADSTDYLLMMTITMMTVCHPFWVLPEKKEKEKSAWEPASLHGRGSQNRTPAVGCQPGSQSEIRQ